MNHRSFVKNIFQVVVVVLSFKESQDLFLFIKALKRLSYSTRFLHILIVKIATFSQQADHEITCMINAMARASDF